MKWRILLLIVALFVSYLSNAQDSLKKLSPIKIEIHGFVKSDFWMDSRQVVQSRDGLFMLYPLQPIIDKNGQDLNGHSSFNFSPIASRVAMKISGPEAFGAKTTALIEADFTGMSNATINTLRLRHAWIRLQWEKAGLTLGQDWHPAFVTDVFPEVLALNTGAPFQPFIRNPQIRFDYQIKKFNLILAAISQRDNSNIGPIGRDFSYLSNSMIPNLHGRIQFKAKKHVVGVAVDWKSIVPRLKTDSNLISDERLNSTSVLVFHKFENNRFQIKTKLIYGENLTEHSLLGGYAIAAIDSNTDHRNYTSTKHFFAWTNLIYTIKKKNTLIMPSIFLGFAQNLGTKENNIGVYYATGSNIDKLFRISPAFSIKNGPVMLTFEWELTRAFYGNPNNDGIILISDKIDNHRLMLAAIYFF
jgi:hypothetical protein